MKDRFKEKKKKKGKEKRKQRRMEGRGKAGKREGHAREISTGKDWVKRGAVSQFICFL